MGGDPERGRKPRALIERGLTTRALLWAALLDKPFAGIWRREEKLTGFGRIKDSEIGEEADGVVAIEDESRAWEGLGEGEYTEEFVFKIWRR